MAQQMCPGPRHSDGQLRRETGGPGRRETGCYEHPFGCGLRVSSYIIIGIFMFWDFTSVCFSVHIYLVV